MAKVDSSKFKNKLLQKTSLKRGVFFIETRVYRKITYIKEKLLVCRNTVIVKFKKEWLLMRILGIDPGTAITGYGIVDIQGNKLKLVEHGVFRTKSTLYLPERLHQIFLNLNNLIKEYSPDEMAVEQLFFNTNAKTALSVGHARGVILLAGVEAGLKISEYTPLQIKQGITGYGLAEKAQVQRMICNLLNLKTGPHPNDAADALAVAICHIHSFRMKSVFVDR